jgi:hypothetical protein
MAGEIARDAGERSGIAWQRTWSVAFVFGLLHGLGFAGALSEIGLPENAVPLALLFFNIGVEIGQLVFVFTVLAVIGLVRRWTSMQPDWTSLRPDWTSMQPDWTSMQPDWTSMQPDWTSMQPDWTSMQPDFARTAVAYGIGTIASFWTIQRVVGFWY